MNNLSYSLLLEHIPKEANLRFLWEDLFLEKFGGPIAFQHLTTLHLLSIATERSLEGQHLPSLRYLSIDVFLGTRKEAYEKILEVARHLGKNLVTLHYRYLLNCPIPDIWPHIQQVERIQLPYWEGTIIPVDHPVRIVTVCLEQLLGSIRGIGDEHGDDSDEFAPRRLVLKYVPHQTQFPVRDLIIKMDVPWFIALMLKLPASSVYSTGDVIWLPQYCEDTGAKFTDSGGITFQRYLVFLIQYFGKIAVPGLAASIADIAVMG